MVYHMHDIVNVQPEANTQVYDNSRRRTELPGSDLLMGDADEREDIHQ